MRPFWYLTKEEWRKERNRLKEFCREYPSMLMKLESMEAYLKPGSPVYDGMPKANNNVSSTEAKAVRLASIRDKVDMIHLAAELADPELAQYIVKYVTDNNYTYELLKKRYDVLVGRAGFYKKVGDFYHNLYQLRYEYEMKNESLLRRRIKQGKARRDWAHDNKAKEKED